MAKLKFGSPAWRKKYMGRRNSERSSADTEHRRKLEREEKADLKRHRREVAKEKRAAAKRARDDVRWQKRLARLRTQRTNKPKRKAAQRKRTASHKRGTTAKKKRMREMIGNPPGSWTKVKAFRVVKKNGRAVLEVRK